MAALCQRVLILTMLLLAAPQLPAASSETRAFNAATELLRGAFYEEAEVAFADFAAKFPASPRAAEAILCQAESRVELTNYAGAVELLSSHYGAAGTNADEYLFWMAEARLRSGDYTAARDDFDRLVKEFPGSPRRLEASIKEAEAQMKLSEWADAAELLAPTNSVFQTAARANPTNEFVLRGQLLLAKARLAQKEFASAEAILLPMANLPLAPEFDWQRQHLLCRILVADGRTGEALAETTKLLALAAATGERELKAESFSFQAGLLEQSRQLDDARYAYTNNTASGVSPEWQRQALLKITGIFLDQNNLDDAALTLGEFLHRLPNAPAADLAWLTLGEVRLRQRAASADRSFAADNATNALTATNYLDLALAALQTFTNKFPDSPLYGKAQLDLGWCYWQEGNMPKSEAAFQAAVQRLPASADQATAYYKLADTQFRQTNFASAAANYSAIISRFGDLPEVRTNLFEPALYQMVRAALANGDQATASNALAKIIALYPDGFYTDRAALLAGQEVSRRDPGAARHLFEDFLRRTPQAPLAPEVKLAIARTYEQEDQWPAAIEQYDHWLADYTNQPVLLPQAEYWRAWANFQARRDTNAFTQFTNFIARFPTNEFVPLAQWWVADYYFRIPDHLAAAEAEYQAIYLNTNFPPSELAYQARMMAGRAAVARENWKDAKDYFTGLVNNTNCSTRLQAQAFFALGDCWISQDSTNKLEDYQEAFKAYDRISRDWPPDSQQAVVAWGKKAEVLLQLAQTAEDYASVTNAFQHVLTNSIADATARSIAKVGMGTALEHLADIVPDQKTSLLHQALAEYLGVFFPDSFLRGGEQENPFWTRKAGLEAARLAALLKEWDKAINICIRLRDLFPSQASQYDEKITKLKAQKASAADKS